MAGKNYHVVRRGDGWGVRGEGNTRDSSHHRTQADAINAGRELAQGQRSELFIHGRDGKFRERYSYGNDPFPPEG